MENPPILVTGAAGRVGAIGRTVTELLLKQGKPVRAMVRNDRLAGSPGEPPRDNGRFAPRGTLRPDVRRGAHANGARAAEHAGVRPQECRDIHRIRKRGLSVRLQPE